MTRWLPPIVDAMTFGLIIQWFQGNKKVKAMGMSGHSNEEVEAYAKNDLRVLSEMLADKPFFFGDEPTSVSRFYNSTSISQRLMFFSLI